MGLTVPVTEVLDPAKWRERFAYGVVLGRGSSPVEDELLTVAKSKTAGGKAAELTEAACEVADELPDDVIRFHLRSALSELELKTGMPFGIVVCKATPVDGGLVQGRDYDAEVPRLPYQPSEVRQFYRLDLPTGVISVQRVRLYWYNQLVWTLDNSNNDSAVIQLEHPGISSLHLMPVTGALFSLGPLYADPVFSIFQTLQPASPGHLPSSWAVDYTLGPKTKTGVQGLEAALATWVYARAALPLLAIAGQARTQGVAAASLSIDGLGKSVTLAGGGSSHIHVALATVCQQVMDSIDWKSIVTYKRGLRIRATGF